MDQTDKKGELPDYYNHTYPLHWNPSIERKGLGNLLKKVNHVAIIVSDIGRSLSFYTEILGFQQIRRPNFDRHGAWLTMGNIELHLIKGPPLAPKGDNLIVGHISVETDDIEGVLEKLNEMKVPFSRNVSVPDATESKPITQYFIRDPDGYYIELCNCDILTKFCLGEDKYGVQYHEIVENVELSLIFRLVCKVQQLRKSCSHDKELPLPEDQWAKEVDNVKLQNLLNRGRTYGDLMQGETEESIRDALKKANNNVPLATRIIRYNKKGKEIFLPPAFYQQGKTRYQPKALEATSLAQSLKLGDSAVREGTERVLEDISYEAILRKTFHHFDKNNDGTLGKDEIRKLLISLRQNPDSSTFAHIFEAIDKDKSGSIDQEEFVQMMTKEAPTTTATWDAFFHLLDIDGNGKITSPELCMILRELGFQFTDHDIENVFISADDDGNGYLTLDELKKLVLE